MDATQLAADLDAIIADLNCGTMTWSGQTITVSLDDLVRSDEIPMAGVFQTRDIGVYAKQASFTSSILPEVGDKVTLSMYSGVTFRITGVRAGPDGVGVQFSLQRKSA